MKMIPFAAASSRRESQPRMLRCLWLLGLGAAGLMLTGCHYYDDYPQHHRAAYSGHGHYVDHGDYEHQGHYDDYDAPHYSGHGHHDSGYYDDHY